MVYYRTYFIKVKRVIFENIFKESAMIEYAKVILPKVSFNKFLFRKELIKCIGWMKPAERSELQQWCFSTFSQYKDVLEEAFTNTAA